MSPAKKPRTAAGNGRVALRWLPTFLGIGTMQCESTRRYEVLKWHPEVWISDSKEMDFFFMLQISRCSALAELEPPANNPSI